MIEREERQTAQLMIPTPNLLVSYVIIYQDKAILAS